MATATTDPVLGETAQCPPASTCVMNLLYFSGHQFSPLKNAPELDGRGELLAACGVIRHRAAYS